MRIKRNSCRVSERKRMREDGLSYRDLAEKYFNMGLQNMNAMRDTTLDKSSTDVISDRREAVRNFRRAKRYCEKALAELGPEDKVVREEIRQTLSTAQRHLKKLTRTKPRELPRSRRIRL